MTDLRLFPILTGSCSVAAGVPWDMVASHEKQALANHDQTLAVLASRGGLDWCELEAVMAGRQWHLMKPGTAERHILNRVNRFWADRASLAAKEAAEIVTLFVLAGPDPLVECLRRYKSGVEARITVLEEAVRAAQEMQRKISAGVSAASCETQDAESEPWERLVHGYWFDGMMASYVQQFESAVGEPTPQPAEVPCSKS